MMNKITNVEWQYLKAFNYVQTNDEYKIELLVEDKHTCNYFNSVPINELLQLV